MVREEILWAGVSLLCQVFVCFHYISTTISDLHPQVLISRHTQSTHLAVRGYITARGSRQNEIHSRCFQVVLIYGKKCIKCNLITLFAPQFRSNHIEFFFIISATKLFEDSFISSLTKHFISNPVIVIISHWSNMFDFFHCQFSRDWLSPSPFLWSVIHWCLSCENHLSFCVLRDQINLWELDICRWTESITVNPTQPRIWFAH